MRFSSAAYFYVSDIVKTPNFDGFEKLGVFTLIKSFEVSNLFITFKYSPHRLSPPTGYLFSSTPVCRKGDKRVGTKTNRYEKTVLFFTDIGYFCYPVLWL